MQPIEAHMPFFFSLLVLLLLLFSIRVHNAFLFDFAAYESMIIADKNGFFVPHTVYVSDSDGAAPLISR